jgi:hypothetical protein
MSRPIRILPIVTLGAAALWLAGAARAETKGCDEACLLGVAADYMDSLSANDPAGAPLAKGARTTENGAPTPLTQGLWSTARAWRYRHTFADPMTGEIGAFGVVSEGPDKDAMTALRLKVVGRKIVESELLVARAGDFALFKPDWTSEAKPIFTSYIPRDLRDSRAALGDIPRRYFAAIRHGDPGLVPVHPDANRFENGVQTTNAQGFLSSSTREGLRRLVYMQSCRGLRVPVIDPTRGLVLAVVAIDMPVMTKTLSVRGRTVEINPERQHLPRTLFLFELFKVEGGQIRAIEAVMRNMPLGADMGWGGEASR